MSNYTQEQQTSIVHDAMKITIAIQEEKHEIAELRKEQFRSRPSKPIRTVVSVTEVHPKIPPRPVSSFKYRDVAAKPAAILAVIWFTLIVITSKLNSIFLEVLLFMMFVPGISAFLVLSYKSYSKKKKQLDDELASSPEYLAEVERAVKDAARRQNELTQIAEQRQKELDMKHQSQLEYYQTVELPEYERALRDWNQVHSLKLNVIEDDLHCNIEALQNLYDTTKLISVHYRELWILRWLYDDMRSSDHDIRYATELLDRDRQRLATEQAGKMIREAMLEVQSVMMEGFTSVYSAIEEGTSNVQIEMSKMHKNLKLSNMADALGIYQRYKTNKILKDNEGETN